MTTQRSLTLAQGETLRALLGVFVPASADARMPAAADLPELVGRIAAFAAPVPAIGSALDLLEAEALSRRGVAFAALDEANRSMLLNELGARDAGALRELALETVTCYYQQDRVLQGLGLEARAPYPKGYQVISGDLGLLHPVKARGRIYRDPGQG
jgi:hypothetical protein